MAKRLGDGANTRIDRRGVLQLGAGLAVIATGCGSSASPTEVVPVAPAGTSTGNPPTGNPPSTVPTSTPDAGTTPPDAGTPDAANDPPKTPEELLAGIDTIVVVMMENRSFDHYFGRLKSDLTYANASTVNGLTGNETNPDNATGAPVGIYKLDTFTADDPPHDWDACHTQWNSGANNGFIKAHAGASEKQVMGYYDRSQMPFMYWLADNFTICDTWYASVMGPTWPNRYYLHATSSNGEKTNSPFTAGGLPTVWERMKAKGKSAKNYYAGAIGWFAGAFPTKLFSGNPLANLDTFFSDAKNGTLPNFSIIDPDFTANDDHPAHDIQKGQAFLASIYKAVAASPQWERCLLVITYDEHGGFFDHVAPPTCDDAQADFRQLGFRVPSIIIGPTVRNGYVLKTPLEHSSVAATLATRFDIDSLSLRMDKANDLSSAIDPAKLGKPAKPAPTAPALSFTNRAEWLHTESESSQPQLEELRRAGRIPSHAIDARSRSARLQSWIRNAEALGAIAPASANE